MNMRLAVLGLLIGVAACDNPAEPEQCTLLVSEQRNGYAIQSWSCPAGVEPPCAPGHYCPPPIVVTP